MTATDLYHRLTLRGFELDLSPEGKLVITPASGLTDDMRTAIKAHKTELLLIIDREHHRNMMKRFSVGAWRKS